MDRKWRSIPLAIEFDCRGVDVEDVGKKRVDEGKRKRRD